MRMLLTCHKEIGRIRIGRVRQRSYEETAVEEFNLY